MDDCAPGGASYDLSGTSSGRRIGAHRLKEMRYPVRTHSMGRRHRGGLPS